jgi:uncharacterized protein (DUF58 family)
VTPQRIYILPTFSWIALSLVLAAMWYAAISQGNSAAYLLMFFLASLVLVSAIHAHFALTGLSLQVGRIEPVFAGETARVTVEVRNASRRARAALEVAPDGHVFQEPAHAAVPEMEPGATGAAELTYRTTRRGRLVLNRLAITTIYPLGFFRSWRYEVTDAFCLVFPPPQGSLPLPAEPAAAAEMAGGIGLGGDDFAGARPYQTGESQRHVDWRAVARGQPLLVKQFAGAGSRRVWLNYESLAHLAGVEPRLSQLSAWIVEAERNGYQYGLRLPEFTAEPARGNLHYQRCLSALADFQP